MMELLPPPPAQLLPVGYMLCAVHAFLRRSVPRQRNNGSKQHVQRKTEKRQTRYGCGGGDGSGDDDDKF